MSLLLSQQAPPFDPASGFPYEQPPGPPAHNVPMRATALLLAATAFVFVPPPVNPANVPTWLPDYPDQAAVPKPRATGLHQDPESKPPSQFGTAVRFVGLDQNDGLHTETAVPGPSSYSVCVFFFKQTATAGDSTIWAIQDTTPGTTPTNFHNVEILSDNEILFAWNGGFVNVEPPGGFVPGKWHFACISVGVGGNADAYVGVVGGPLTHTVITTVSTGWTPASLSIDTDYFVENLDGRITSVKVYSGVALSGTEALAESTKLVPVRTANVSHFFKLEHASTKLVDSSGFGRNLTAIGAGTWQDEEGPFLQPGSFDPSLSVVFVQPPGPPAHLVPKRCTALLETGLTEVPRAGLGAVAFNSAADALFRSGLPVNNTSYSVCGWAKFDSSTGDESLIFVSDAAGTGLALDFKTGQVALVDTFGFSHPATITGALVNQKWYFIGLRVNGTSATIFRGSEGDAVVSATGTIVAQGASSKIWLSFTSNFFTGALSQWTLYDAQLTDAEFEAQRLSSIAARSANLTGYWKLASEADELVDSSGNVNTLSKNSTGPWENVPGPKLDFVSKMAWQPSFPDFTRKTPTQVDRGGEAPLVFTPVQQQVSLGWLPEYPDFARKAPQPVESGGLFRTHLEYEPTTDWLPDYPDFARAAPRPVNEGGQFKTQTPPGLGAVGFNSVADALGRSGLPINNTSYSACGWVKFDVTTGDDSFIFLSDGAGTGLALEWKTGVLNLVDTHGFSRPASVGGTAVDQKWYFVGLRVNGTTATIFLGTELDAVLNSSGTIVAQGASNKIWFSFTSTPLTGALSRWKLYDAQLSNAEFEAERVASSPFRTANLTGSWAFESVITETVDFSGNGNNLSPNSTGPWEDVKGPDLNLRLPWLPEFPDFVRSVLPPTERGGTSFIFTPVAAPVSLGWLPDYPDFPKRASLPPVNEGGLFRTHLEYEPTTDWLPNYSDFAGRAAPRPVNEGGESFANFDFVPKLAWSPSYPDFARSKPRPVSEGQSVIVVQEYEPTDWFPSYPDFAYAAQRATSLREGYAFLNPDFVPKSAWAPDYPDFAGRAAARPVNTGGLFWTNVEYEPSVDWLPKYPDFPGRAALRATALLEFGETFLDPDFVPKLAWDPSYPDFARRAALRPVNEGGLFRTHLEYEPTTDWTPSYPDFPGLAAKRATALVETGLSFLDPDFVPKLAWSPSYPDFARSKPRPVDTGLSVIVIQEREPVTDWLPDYPDFAGRAPLRATALREFGSEFFVKVEREPQLDWVPDYPDFAGRAAPRAVNEGGYYFQRFTPVVVAQLWYPDYPDFARGPQRPVGEGWIAFVKLEREPVTDWLPDFPDRVPGPRQPLNVGGYAAFDNFDFVPKLGWSPDFPDFARAAPRVVNTGGLFPTPSFNLTPPLSWSPDYPDFARGARHPLNVGGLASFLNFDFVPKLSWAPDYPEFAPASRGKPRLVTEGFSVFPIQEREPIVDWLPDYPDFARKARPPVNEGGVFWTQYEYEPTTDWRPEYPDFPGRALPRALNVGGSVFSNLDYTPKLAWSPTFPDFTRALPRPVDTGMLGYTRIFIRTPDIEWLPHMPDFIWAKAPLVQEGGTFFVKLEREPSTDWMPTFPDFIWAAARPVNVGGISPSEIDEDANEIFEMGTVEGDVQLRCQMTLLGGESRQLLRPAVEFVIDVRGTKKEESEEKPITTDDVKGRDPVV